MKPYIVRKSRDCGCWRIFQITISGAYIFAREVAHFESFSDVLVAINMGVWVTNGN